MTRAARPSGSPPRIEDRIREVLALVGVPDAGKRIGSCPHELSGGMRQRVMIAIALASGLRR